MARHPIDISIQHSPHDTQAIGWAFVMKAKQHHPGMRLTAAEDEFTEILVVCDEDSPLAHGSRQDIAIACLRHGFGDRKHVVTGTAQVLDDRYAGTLIYDEPHRRSDSGRCREGENLFLRQNPRGIGEGRADILGLQAWVFAQDIRL